MKASTKITQVLLSLMFLIGVLGATAVLGHAAFVSPTTVLTVIQK
jgi:hypothetical protein